MSFIVRVLINGLAIWLTSLFLNDHFFIVGSDSVGGKILVILAVALIFALVNAIIKPILKVLSFPLYILTLGLFSLVVNALMLMLTAWITELTDWGIRIEGGFWWALWAAVVIAVLNFVISAVVPGKQRSNK